MEFDILNVIGGKYKDYNVVKDNLFNEIHNEDQWLIEFESILEHIGVSKYFADGSYKHMDALFGDITLAYMQYQHDINKAMFSGL